MTDYIDRQAAIRWIKTECNPYGKPTIDYESGVKVIDHIETMSSAEVEPVKHGRWEPVTNGRGGFECSICHSYAPSYQDGVEWLSLYCPNCGAKMNTEEGEPHEQN